MKLIIRNTLFILSVLGVLLTLVFYGMNLIFVLTRDTAFAVIYGIVYLTLPLAMSVGIHVYVFRQNWRTSFGFTATMPIVGAGIWGAVDIMNQFAIISGCADRACDQAPIVIMINASIYVTILAVNIFGVACLGCLLWLKRHLLISTTMKPV
ncbi:MAG: hypothetical protein HC853_01420 [Anaerolineae bacterium]|nr:hypothetical protein [Anaerolineae bacterium]